MTPFGLLVVPEVNAISAGLAGSARDGAGHRLIGEQFVEVMRSVPLPFGRRCPHVGFSDQANDRHVRAQVGLKLHPPELLGGDEHLRPRGGQDVTEFLGP